MHIFYSNVKSKGNQAMSPSARREMRNAIIDYGALQPSPVQAADSGSEEETLVSSSLLVPPHSLAAITDTLDRLFLNRKKRIRMRLAQMRRKRSLCLTNLAWYRPPIMTFLIRILILTLRCRRRLPMPPRASGRVILEMLMCQDGR